MGLKCHLLPGWVPWDRVKWDLPWVFYWAPAVCQASGWKLGHYCLLSTLHVMERHAQALSVVALQQPASQRGELRPRQMR